MLIPFVFPEIVFTSILVNVGPLNVELVEDRRNWIRIEGSRVAVERTQRTVAHSRPQAVDSPTAVNWNMLKKKLEIVSDIMVYTRYHISQLGGYS